MGEAESYSGAPGGARKRDKELRARAQLAWDRVQTVLQRRKTPRFSTADLIGIIDSVPTEGYLAGLAGSFLASFLLETTKHRRTGAFTGIWLPLGLAVALYTKVLRQFRNR